MTNACIAAVKEAIGDKLSEDELIEVFEKAQGIRQRLEAQGKIDRLDQRILDAAREEAEKLKTAASIQRRQTYLGIVKRQRFMERHRQLVDAGMPPEKAIYSMLVGTSANRVSVDATYQAYQARYVGGMNASIFGERAHLQGLTQDKDFNEAVVREMYELREGGKPGRTGNEDAQFAAKKLLAASEVVRGDINQMGGVIGKLDGWTGPQRHNTDRMLKVGKEAWVDEILPRLDAKRSFPDATSEADLRKILNGVYDHIVTGVDLEGDSGGFVGPSNLAKTVSRQRVLHFKDADAWIEYNNRMGDGGIFASMYSHMQVMSRVAAQLDTFGPNPEHSLQKMLTDIKRQVRTRKNLTPEQKAKQVSGLELSSETRIGQAFSEVRGLTMTAQNRTVANWGQGYRNFINMTTLGGATVTAVPTDAAMVGIAGQMRGSGFVKSLGRQFKMATQGMSTTEQRQFYMELGQGFDMLAENVVHAITDGGVMQAPGHLAKATTQFFKWTGLSGWTDIMRRTSAGMISRELGDLAASPMSKMSDRQRLFLERHNITPETWDVVRAQVEEVDGLGKVISPTSMRKIGDKKQAKDLEIAMARLVADETSFAILAPDARSRRLALAGTKAGTFGGEARRFLFQFKSFPVAFTQRVLGRAVRGNTGRMAGVIDVGTILATLTIAGYASMTAKDLLRGRTPREVNAKSVMAAALQGGALGIYGDFVLGEANRFGNSLLETLAGPGLGKAATAGMLLQRAARGEASGVEAVNAAQQFIPGANIWYLRPAVETLFTMRVKEALSPGYRRRMERRLKKESGQELLF